MQFDWAEYERQIAEGARAICAAKGLPFLRCQHEGDTLLVWLTADIALEYPCGTALRDLANSPIAVESA